MIKYATQQARQVLLCSSGVSAQINHNCGVVVRLVQKGVDLIVANQESR